MNAAENRWRAAWWRGGRISEVAWVGQNALAWCSSLRVIFLDVHTNKLRLPRFSKEVTSGGACCLSGHLSTRIFAFSERNSKPRIFVYAYPSMQKISECIKGTNYAYLATAFAGDLLVSLGSMPDFHITFWSWRTGEKIASVNTVIHDAGEFGQSLRVNFKIPIMIAQIGNRTGRLCIWDATVCNNNVILRKNEIILPKRALVKDAAWNPDSSNVIAIADRDGHIYLTDFKGNEIKRIITASQDCAFTTEMEPRVFCWFRDGLVLHSAFCQIHYYRKNVDDLWENFWKIRCPGQPYTVISHPLRNSLLFFTTIEGHVVQVKVSEDYVEATQEIKQFNGGKYRFVDFVHPWDDRLVAIDQSGIISVIEAHHGAEITNIYLKIKGDVTQLLSHPDLPLVIISSDEGEVVFMSLMEFDNPKILGKCRLQPATLDLMKFSNSGRFLVACQKNEGTCYFINVTNNLAIDVIARLSTSVNIIDVLLFEVQACLKFYVLKTSANLIPIGNKILFYELPSGQLEFKKIPTIFSLTRYYQYLHYAPGESNKFLATPFLSKTLKIFKLNDWKDIVIVDAIPNGHKVRQVKIFSNRDWLLTTSIAGLIVLRNAQLKLGKAKSFISHHRRNLGVASATVNIMGDLVIALGNDGSLVLMKDYENVTEDLIDDQFKSLYEFRQDIVVDKKNKMAEYALKIDESNRKFLSTPINAFLTLENLTWVEWKHREKIEKDKKKFTSEKEHILSIFSSLKNKVIRLLNKNQISSEMERLPISAFALNKTFREKKTKAAKDEREEVRLKLESDCQEMMRVSDWIQKKFWEPQQVLGQSIFGIFDKRNVTNYTICPEVIGLSDLYDYSQFMRNVIKELTYDDTLYPCEFYPLDKVNESFDNELKVKKTDDIDKIDKIMDTEEEQHIDLEAEENKRIFEGTTTHHFIEPQGTYFSQFKIYAYVQVLCDNHNIKSETKRLRLYFNKLFNDMYSIKEREMNLVCERINRILHISSELRGMFHEHVSEMYYYPKWDLKEKPQDIIQVVDSEILAKVYVSPSQQFLLDKQAEELEHLRLAMLADDFRERAIMRMMDGLLEVRWEDLIKRDIPKPECLVVGKSPADYTDDEAAAVKRYEQDVKNLEVERARYRKNLQSEYAKNSRALKEGIEKFNSRLEEFHLLKMKVESAIQQLNLRYVRYLVRHLNRLSELKNGDVTQMKIDRRFELIRNIKEDVEIILAIEPDLHGRYENLISKNRTLEKRLKVEFSAVGKSAFTLLLMQYKRRPRTALKTISSYEVQDLGKSITSMIKLPYLSAESLEYIKQLELLDVRPAAVPHSVSTSHWENLVALRRLKIDQELKERAVAIELEGAAGALLNYSHRLAEHQLAIERMRGQLASERKSSVELDLDAEIQLVLKMGQMEMPRLRGSVTKDWPGAVLVRREEIDEVNGAIAAMGRRKLRSIERSLEFRRGIVIEAWEHRAMKARVEYLEVGLYYIRTAHVTRGIQEYLKMRAKGQRDDKGPQKLARDYEATRVNQEKILREWERKLESSSKELERLGRKNRHLDDRIMKMNVDRWDMELMRDVEGEERHKSFRGRVDKLMAARSAMLRRLLQNYNEILEIQKERENSCRRMPLTSELESPDSDTPE